VAAGERLEREEEREADLAALVDPPEPRAVGEELALVRLEDDGRLSSERVWYAS